MTELLWCQLARCIENKPKYDKMIRDIKKQCELSSTILFPLSTCSFKKWGVMQNTTLLFGEFILVLLYLTSNYICCVIVLNKFPTFYSIWFSRRTLLRMLRSYFDKIATTQNSGLFGLGCRFTLLPQILRNALTKITPFCVLHNLK
jgi:hypothetical protein